MDVNPALREAAAQFPVVGSGEASGPLAWISLTSEELALAEEVAQRRRKPDTRSLVALKEAAWDPDYVGILGEMAFCKGLNGNLNAWLGKVEQEGWFKLGEQDPGYDFEHVNVKTTLLRNQRTCRSLRLLVSVDPRHTDLKQPRADVLYVAGFWRPGSRRVYFAGWLPGWRIVDLCPVPRYPGLPANTFLSYMVRVPDLWQMRSLRTYLSLME